MKRPVKRLATLFATLVGAAAFSTAAIADDAHRHGTTLPDPGASASETEVPPSPMPLSAEDMLGLLETMPKHDDAHCCGTRKNEPAKNDHDH